MPSPKARTRRPLVVASIMLATFTGAIEATIVATAMPRIVGELGGFAYYSWVFSAFLLAQTTTTVVYGKLSDMYGRKPMLIGGILLFLFGSLLCGFANSMGALVLFRLLQGLGAGAIQPVTMTVVGDLYTLEERGKVQGLLASVWASSAVIGPLAGAVIVDNLSWAWIFWVNIPFGLIAIAGFMLFLHETIEPRERSIDYLGVVLFSIATVSLLTLLTETSAPLRVTVGLACIVLAAGFLFLWQERRAAEPMISLELWSRRLIATCNGASLVAGMTLIGLTTILPLYVQGVLGRSPIVAGFTLTSLVIGWPLAVSLSSRFFRIFGIRRTLRAGSVMFPLGATCLMLLTPHSHPGLAAVGAFMMGFGMGLSSVTCIILIQDSVEWSMRGSATASFMFARSLGSTLGATVLGAILNIGIARFATGETAGRVHEVLDRPAGLADAAHDLLVHDVLAKALHLTYWGVLAMAVLAFVTCWLIPIDRVMRKPATVS
ncbi:drug resistance transporter, EmrB/QacA subfamily [Rhizobiales bacterium GAS191]|nr:drug resistance transporter, EmrB/QacA subfamily [Rhizobiales bacterium GAS113]SEE30754.1 drug resistance transporter, EmrB/QacA subfamily [Rhizobiales bacterium GAS191]